MRKALVRSLAIVGGLTIIGLLFLVAAGLIAAAAKGRVPSRTVLEVNLETELVEDTPQDSVARAMLSGKPTVRDVVDALERASNDNRVAGIIARFGGSTMGMAQAQEIRDAVRNFRAHRKFAVAWSETFGEVGQGSSSYYLATAFDEIWMQPSGDIGLTGLMLQSQFLRGTLEKLNVAPRMDHRYEYKNAMNVFTERQFTPAHREAMAKVAESWYGQLVRGIAEGRKLAPEEVRALIDRGPFLGQEAQKVRLVDGLAYRDDVYAKVKGRAGQGAKLLYLDRYLERAKRPHQSGQTVALIYGVGAVMRGGSAYSPVFGSTTMGSDTVTAAFRAAIDDPKVKAIVFRIDSPGGSYVASDAIWRETVRARKAGKPVIASMGNLAGSGGYFVAMSADKIVAQPGTITGSIGVLGGKMITTGLWQKLGITFDEVHQGANAAMWSSTTDYSPAEWERFQAWLDRVYTDFTTKVAEGRKLPKERVLQIAKGRIWTGEDAKNLGLVDELGGYPAALRLAKAAASIPASADVNVVVFPKKKSTMEALLATLQGERPESSERDAAGSAMVEALRLMQPVARQVRAVTGGVETLEMPGFAAR